MRIGIKKSKLEGKVAAPASKSYTHRALICSALAKGQSSIISPLLSDDTQATFNVLEKLGVNLKRSSDSWVVNGGVFQKPETELYCGESGTTIRFLTALSALVDGTCKLTGGKSLSNRPIGPLIHGLDKLGIECESNNGFPPVTVKGQGQIEGGEVSMSGDISSQFISAILLVAPFAEKGVKLTLSTPLESKPYVSMTMDTQRNFGVDVQASKDMTIYNVRKQNYHPYNFKVEGDWSSASYLLAAGVLAGRVTIEGLKRESLQADSRIIDVMEMMGAKISYKGDSISVYKSPLQAISFDVSDCPDLFPIISALCATAQGRSLVSGIKRLRFKESDRLLAMIENLRDMRIQVSIKQNVLNIIGGTPQGCSIDTKSDHRIAMAFAVLGLVTDGRTVINHAECVSKSYPRFWDTMKYLGMDWRRISHE